ncbi:bridging integrator 3-like [Asterias rubens]|uniref:bridging integrator 3-like n=1 Tax=Asterias rubens TaxID=7604 RepID=UPI0014553BA8|nr:bridging integrator 3-like [Asterias rubens]
MSWNIFSRLTSPKKAPPVISKEEEKEFEREVHKIEVLDEATKKLYKDMKHCIEAMGALSKTQCRIGQNLAASPVLNTEESLKSLEQINKSISQIESRTQELNANSVRMMIEPMKKFSTIFPSLYIALKKREQCLQEYSRCQGKLEKYQDRERTGPNLAKLESCKKNLEAAKEEYDRQHKELMEAMPSFFEGRVEYFQPCFEALIKSQVTYYTECFKIYVDLAVQLEDKDTLQSDEDFEMDLHRRLCEIRALSIVVDD